MDTKEMKRILMDEFFMDEEIIDMETTIHGDNEETYEGLLFWTSGMKSFEEYMEDEE